MVCHPQPILVQRCCQDPPLIQWLEGRKLQKLAGSRSELIDTITSNSQFDGLMEPFNFMPKLVLVLDRVLAYCSVMGLASARLLRKEADGYLLPENKQEQCLLAQKLPVELLSQIFLHLDPRDLLGGAALVSQQWQRCSLEPRVWICRLGLPGLQPHASDFSSRWTLPRLFWAAQASNLLNSADWTSSQPSAETNPLTGRC